MMFCKKGIHKNFAKFTEKHLCQILVFNKVAGLRIFLWNTPLVVHSEVRNNNERQVLTHFTHIPNFVPIKVFPSKYKTVNNFDQFSMPVIISSPGLKKRSINLIFDLRRSLSKIQKQSLLSTF